MLMTQTEWAKIKGFTPQYVNKLVKAGKIRLIDGRVDSAQADKALAAMRNPARALGRTGVPSAEQTRADFPVQQARPAQTHDRVSSSDGDLTTMLLKAKVKNEIARGISLGVRAALDSKESINAKEAEEAWATWTREFRSAMEQWPNRDAGAMASELGVDAKKLRIVLEKHIRRLLFEIAGQSDKADG